LCRIRQTAFSETYRAILFCSAIVPASGEGCRGASTNGYFRNENRIPDEQYEKAKKEGGQLTLYVALSNRSQEVILTELQ
jgi:hypothetical protein